MSNTAATKNDLEILDTKIENKFDELRVDIKNDISEVIDIMKSFMNQVDDRFNRLELSVDELKQDIQKILNHIDSIEKDISINDDERAVIGMQLTRMHDWIEKAAAKIGVEFTH